MKASSRCKKNSRSELIRESVAGVSGSGRKINLPALIALGSGCGLLAGPAAALELGEIQVHSALGQPLRASVAFVLQPNEQVHDYCIYLRPGTATSGLPGVSNATIAIANGTIGITGRAAIREPLVSLQLTVDCPYSAHLRREYSVFLDPALPTEAGTPVVRSAGTPVVRSAGTPVVRSVGAPVARPTPRRAAATPRPAARPAIPSSGTYRVQPGDSLSGIASRISGRSVGIWQAVDAIFAANTEAFIDNDKNLLRAGAVLSIPDSILASEGSGTVQAGATRNAEGVDRSEPATTSNALENTPASLPVDAPAGLDTATAPAALERPQTSGSAREGRMPGSGTALPDSDNPFVSLPGGDAARVTSTPFPAPVEVIPPTVVEATAATQAAPVVVRAVPPRAGDSWTWLMWLGGSGIAVILALLLFGRRLKERFVPSYGAAAAPSGRRTDGAASDDTDVSPVLDLPARGTVARVVSLDADVEDGSGLQYVDVDVAQDFGFSDSGAFGSPLDMDLTSASGTTAARSTGVIQPRRLAEESILVSETPPRHDDTGEYDLSMMVDATKQILEESEDMTTDLRAIEVSTVEKETVSEQYDVTGDIDYKVLEQDYEAELTATQALNAELARAARELSSQYGKDAMGDTLSDTTINEALDGGMDDETSLLPSAGQAAPGDDETTAMPAARNMPRVADDTSHLAISSNMTLDDTANEQIALHVPAADNDAAVEADMDIDIESAIVDTRKMRAS